MVFWFACMTWRRRRGDQRDQWVARAAHVIERKLRCSIWTTTRTHTCTNACKDIALGKRATCRRTWAALTGGACQSFFLKKKPPYFLFFFPRYLFIIFLRPPLHLAIISIKPTNKKSSTHGRMSICAGFCFHWIDNLIQDDNDDDDLYAC